MSESVGDDWAEDPTGSDVPPAQLLVAIGRELRETNEHLGSLRVYTGITMVVAVAALGFFLLWLFGVITVDVHLAR
jgi:hypothetical protein